MKKVDEIMAELGFSVDAKTEVKEAFIRNLIKASCGVTVATPSEKEKIKNMRNVSPLPERAENDGQLCFDLESCG